MFHMQTWIQHVGNSHFFQIKFPKMMIIMKVFLMFTDKPQVSSIAHLLSKILNKKTGFTPSQQHVKNMGTLIQCEECDK